MRALILGLCAILLSAAPAVAQLYGGGDGASITVKETDNIPNVSGVSSISFTWCRINGEFDVCVHSGVCCLRIPSGYRRPTRPVP